MLSKSMQPSLLVLMIGGWGQAASGPGNLFTWREDGYFDELLATYPAVLIKQVAGAAKLEPIYQAIGTLQVKDKTPLPLMEILHGHGLHISCIADADRYGLITQTLHLNRSTPREHEDWQYIAMPPGECLIDTPGSSTPFVVEACLQTMKTEKNAVIFACLNAPWSVGLSKQIGPTREAVAQTQEAVRTLVAKALDRSLRVLLIGDEGLAETYVSADSLTIHSRPTDSPLPCVLIDKAVEGLSASSSDRQEAIQAGSMELTAEWSDIAPTILALMDIPPRPQTIGKVLFAEHIERLRKSVSTGRPV